MILICIVDTTAGEHNLMEEETIHLTQTEYNERLKLVRKAGYKEGYDNGYQDGLDED